MNLPTLGGRRIRGNLIDTLKIVTDKVEYAMYVFKLNRSGSNIISRINNMLLETIVD